MGEAADALDAGLIARLPPCILVVRAEFDHSERHPGTWSNHPSRVGSSHACVHIVGQRLQLLRPSHHISLFQQKIVCQDLVSRCLPLFHCLHGNLQHITGRIEMGSIDLLAIQPYGQLLENAQMLHIDQQWLNPFARPQLVVSRFHGTHERIGVKWFHQHPFRPFQPNLVESNPGALQNRQRDLVATRMERACLNGNLQQALILSLDVSPNLS